MTSWLRLALAGGAAVAVSFGMAAGVAADDVQPVETVSLGDSVTLTPPAASSVSETATVADAVTVVGPVAIAITETISATDSVVLTPARVILVTEAIHATDSPSVVVPNIPPTVSPIANATIAEGGTFSATGSFSDPDAQSWTATVNYGDGGGPQPLALDSAKGFQLNHVYDDNGAYTLTVTVTDSGGASNSKSATVTVTNVSPEATLTNNGPVAEGSPVTVSFSQQHDASQADTTAGFKYRYACDGSSLGAETAAASVSCTFADNGTHSVLARISDKDGGYTDYSSSIVVTNAAPDGTLSNSGPVGEGQPVTVAWSGQSDPSASDTAAGFTYQYGCDGLPLGSPTTSPTATCTFDDGPSSHSVISRIWDKDGGTTDHTTTVLVTNTPPQAILNNDGPIGEGSLVTVSLSQQHDDSAADTAAGFRYRYACDGTNLGAETSSGSATCTFGDSGIHSVLARISDKDGGYTDYSTIVVVTNMAPDGTLSNSGPVSEGQPVTVAWSGQSDPSASDVVAGFTYRYGCDGVSLGPPTTNATATCTFDDGPSSHSVLSRISDKDGGTTDHTTTVLVTNVAPTATLVRPAGPVNEGSTFSLALTNRLDPSAADAAAGFTIVFDCGDGRGYQASASCPAIDNPSQAVKARISDKDGGSTEYGATVSIANVAPSVTITGPAAGALYQIGRPVSFTGSFTDPGQNDTHTARWSFDAITVNGSITESRGSGTTGATYTFAQAGVYSVRLTVTDKDGGSSTASTVAGQDAIVVVTDPTGGFVAGLGWIQSPAGAYVPDPSLTGKATFEFASTAHGNRPIGLTGFQLKEASLNFHSTSYQWLVVAGSKAQFKGTGELNGVDGYVFLLSAYDGAPDRFRMKIWNPAGTIVYDNAAGSSDDLDVANPQVLGGGSIVVHR